MTRKLTPDYRLTAQDIERAMKAGACEVPPVGTRLANLSRYELQWAALNIPDLTQQEAVLLQRLCGARAWWRNGKMHRERGPAVIRADGTREWWRDGKWIHEEQPR
jgi:hypothetical protein